MIASRGAGLTFRCPQRPRRLAGGGVGGPGAPAADPRARPRAPSAGRRALEALHSARL